MYALNDGQAHIYELKTERDGRGAAIIKIGSCAGVFWFTYIGVHADEYYAAIQTGTSIASRIRILRQNTVESGVIVIIEGKQHRAGKVYHGFNKSGVPVTDITLERLDRPYEFE